LKNVKNLSIKITGTWQLERGKENNEDRGELQIRAKRRQKSYQLVNLYILGTVLGGGREEIGFGEVRGDTRACPLQGVGRCL